jgi:RND family efflux transporter MFP subunit
MDRNNLFKNWILPVVIVLLGIAGYKILLALKPKAKVVQPAERVVPVEIARLESSPAPVMLNVSGDVRAARRVALMPEVGGRIARTAEAFRPGGVFKAGEPMLWINPVDLETALAQAKSRLAEAGYAYQQELGWQEVARHEWNLLDNQETASELEQNLTLRKPHLEKAAAALEAAQASVAKAELDLERACIAAPFNARIVSRSVELGSQVTTQTPLAEIAGTDEYWVFATIPVDHLQWLDIPGTKATIRLDRNSRESVEGEVFALEPELEGNGRLARIVIRIPDPLASPVPLLLGSYVHAELEGRQVADVFAIPSDALHQGNMVWLMNGEDRLQARPVTILWQTREKVFVGEGLAEGETLVLTDIPSPLPGMKLAVAQDEETE